MGHLRSGTEPGQDSHNEVANHKALFSADDQLFDVLLIEICLRQTGLDFLRGFLQLINYGTFLVNFVTPKCTVKVDGNENQNGRPERLGRTKTWRCK